MQIAGAVWQGILGIFVFLFIAYLFSENRTLIKKRHIVQGVGVQILLALLITQFPFIRGIFEKLGFAIETLKAATLEGTKFVFGYLGGGNTPFYIPEELKSNTFVFAFQALPMIIVVSALSMMLFHWRVIPFIVRFLSTGFQKVLKVGGALGVVAGAKVFLGQIESALLIRPYLKEFSRSELFVVMTCGMATTSAAVMPLYGSILGNTITNPISHLLIATLISIPGAIVLSRIMVPQDKPDASGHLVTPYQFSNTMDAVTKGTSDGLNIFWNIAAMLLVMAALVALANEILATLPTWNDQPITLQFLLGTIMSPIAWLMGIPWEEATKAGQLLGTKTILNEVFAYVDLAQSNLSPMTSLIMTYALCGFANFACIGINLAGLSAMAPERRDDIVSLGFKSLVAGFLATCISGTIIGILAQSNSGILG